MEESRPNYELEKIVVDGREVLRDPFSGTFSLKTKEATVYFSPEGRILEVKHHYISRHSQLNPKLVFDFKVEPVLYELLAYERWGRPADKELERSYLKTHGLAVSKFIKDHFNTEKGFRYDIQKGVWGNAVKEKIVKRALKTLSREKRLNEEELIAEDLFDIGSIKGDLIEKVILISFESFRTDRFTEINPCNNIWTYIEPYQLADLLDKNLKAIFLHYERVDITDPIYFFKHLTFQKEVMDKEIKKIASNLPLKSDILYLPPDFK